MKLKKKNWKFIIFAFYILFLVIGCCSSEVIRPIGGSIWRLFTRQYSIEDTKQNIESVLTKELTYHEQIIELNGLKERILGTRIITKGDSVIVKADSGSLVETEDKIGENDILSSANLIQKLQLISEANGADFLYCAAPRKEFYEDVPKNVPYHALENYEVFLNALTKLNVPFVNLADKLEESDSQVSELFYYTDHHWTSYAGFLANKSICIEMGKRYNFNYNEQYTDINSYNVIQYRDWFLGSKGKKVGSSFTKNGADDFELIVPSFRTDMTEELPFKNENRRGSFEDTVLHMENLVKDYYKINTYATYSGGDFRLQIMKNNQNIDGKKILLIRDSFACVVAPFLSLQTSELHICDVRDGDWYAGVKLNMEEYIKKIEPDIVLVLYTGVDGPISSRYDFFCEENKEFID